MPLKGRGGSGGIPEIASGDALKVVRVKSDESGLELATPATGLPAISEGDAAKVLVVKSDESGYELQTPSIGGSDEAAVLAIMAYVGF